MPLLIVNRNSINSVRTKPEQLQTDTTDATDFHWSENISVYLPDQCHLCSIRLIYDWRLMPLLIVNRNSINSVRTKPEQLHTDTTDATDFHWSENISVYLPDQCHLCSLFYCLHVNPCWILTESYLNPNWNKAAWKQHGSWMAAAWFQHDNSMIPAWQQPESAFFCLWPAVIL